MNFFTHMKGIWLATGLMLLAGVLYAQEKTVSGTVTAAEEGALPGVNVLLKGTTTGTVTDLDGNYRLTVPEAGGTLVFSSIGYANQEVEIGNQSTIDITMAEDIKSLSEVVVIGYGTQEKRDATGAVASVKAEEFNQGVIASPEQLIQGKTPGVQITESSGEPGAGINVRIRGTSSVRSGNGPLFVVDGVPLSNDNTQSGGGNAGFGQSSAKNPLNFLNPADIASIDILKDASATAIYGSRGANGVVIITTKSGAGGAGSLDYSYSFGVSNISRKYDLLGRDEFLAAYTEFNGPDAAAALDRGGNTDWQDEIFRTAFTNNHNVSYGGGNEEEGNYRFSLSYFDQEGIVEKSALKRVTARFNGSKKFIDDRLNISTQFTVANNRDNGVPITRNSGFRGDLLGSALKLAPTYPVRENGALVQPSQTEVNPVAILDFSKSYTNTLRALGNISAELTILEGLTFKTVLGFDRSFSSRTDAYSRDLNAAGIADRGRLYLNDTQINNRLWENYFTYTKEFGNSQLTALAGYSYQSFGFNDKNFEFANFRTSDVDIMINNFASAEVEDTDGVLQNTVVPQNSSDRTDELQSYFARLNFSIADKYILTGTVRADGSTRFGGDNKYGIFPSFAFKWRLGDEAFVPDAFTDLGLRVGYGITGNQEIPHNLYQERQRYNGWDIDEGGNINGGGLGTVAFPNENLKWESTAQINIGVDYGFLNNRLTGSLDFYRKNTNDLLIQVVSAQPAVTPFVWTNLDADVINQGVEFSLNGVAVDNDNFSWEILGNVAYNKNIVENFNGLINTGDIDGQGLTGAFSQRIAEGHPLFAYFLREFIGFDSEGISEYAEGDFQKFTGDSPLPTINAGLTNTFRYGGFDLNVFFNGQFGHYIYSNTRNAYFTAGALANGRNVTRDVVGNGEGALNAPDVSTRFLEKGDFVRLQNVTLGYNIPVGESILSSLRFFVTGQNLFVITNYSGQDPEVDVNKAIDGVPSFGIDYTTYPRARTYTVGLNVSF